MRVLIRADGTSGSGTGHVMRAVAIAEAVQASGGDAALLAARLDEPLAQRARELGVEVVRADFEPGSDDDARRVAARAARDGADWIVTDGYTFGTRYQQAMREAGRRLLVVDDYGHCERYCADLVLNPNFSADARTYERRAAGTRLLLGPDYALIRREFRQARSAEARVPERAGRLLVTMGGADPDNVTERVVRALGAAALRLDVVLGPANRAAERLARTLAEPPRVEVLRSVQDMAGVLSRADLAVAAAGITTHELCFMGVPSLLVVLADNQLASARALEREGACENLGWHHALEPAALARRVEQLAADAPRRRALAERGRAKVDGRGAERVVEAMAGA